MEKENVASPATTSACSTLSNREHPERCSLNLVAQEVLSAVLGKLEQWNLKNLICCGDKRLLSAIRNAPVAIRMNIWLEGERSHDEAFRLLAPFNNIHELELIRPTALMWEYASIPCKIRGTLPSILNVSQLRKLECTLWPKEHYNDFSKLVNLSTLVIHGPISYDVQFPPNMTDFTMCSIHPDTRTSGILARVSAECRHMYRLHFGYHIDLTSKLANWSWDAVRSFEELEELLIRASGDLNQRHLDTLASVFPKVRNLKFIHGDYHAPCHFKCIRNQMFPIASNKLDFRRFASVTTLHYPFAPSHLPVRTEYLAMDDSSHSIVSFDKDYYPQYLKTIALTCRPSDRLLEFDMHKLASVMPFSCNRISVEARGDMLLLEKTGSDDKGDAVWIDGIEDLYMGTTPTGPTSVGFNMLPWQQDVCWEFMLYAALDSQLNFLLQRPCDDFQLDRLTHFVRRMWDHRCDYLFHSQSHIGYVCFWLLRLKLISIDTERDRPYDSVISCLLEMWSSGHCDFKFACLAFFIFNDRNMNNPGTRVVTAFEVHKTALATMGYTDVTSWICNYRYTNFYLLLRECLHHCYRTSTLAMIMRVVDRFQTGEIKLAEVESVLADLRHMR